MNPWKVWNIRVYWGVPGSANDKGSVLSQTVKARNTEEAVCKAGELLRGRFAGVFEVAEKENPSEEGLSVPTRGGGA